MSRRQIEAVLASGELRERERRSLLRRLDEGKRYPKDSDDITEEDYYDSDDEFDSDCEDPDANDCEDPDANDCEDPDASDVIATCEDQSASEGESNSAESGNVDGIIDSFELELKS